LLLLLIGNFCNSLQAQYPVGSGGKSSEMTLENARLKMVVSTDKYGSIERKYFAKKKSGDWQLMAEGFAPQYQTNSDSAIRLWDMRLNPYRYLVTGLPITLNSSGILKLNDHTLSITLHRHNTTIREKVSLGGDDDHFHVQVDAIFTDPHPALDYMLSAYTLFNVSRPDFVHTPGVKFDDKRSGPGKDQITGDRAFLAPALIVQQDENFVALVPDLDAINKLRTISKNARREYLEPTHNPFTIPFVDSLMTMPAGIDFNRHTGLTEQPVMTYGLMDSKIGFHTRFVRKEDDTSMIRELSSAKAGYAFDLFISASMHADGYGRIAQFQWQRYGSPVFKNDYHLAMPIQEYVKLVNKTIFYPIRNSRGGIVETPAGKMDSTVEGFADQGSWLEWQQDGTTVGGFRCSAPFWNDVINNSPFWNQARDAVGMYYWGKERHDDSLVEKARRVINFCLSAPRNKNGLFATVYSAKDKSWGLGWSDPPHGKNVLFLRNANCYEMAALCKTGAHLLDYYIRNEQDKRIIAYLTPFAEWLLRSIDKNGIVPSYVSADNMKASDILYESAQPAAAMWFLAEMYNATKENEFLLGAEKIGTYIEKEIIPSGKWIDMEQYVSCGAKPYSYMQDYWQGLWFRGTLCTIWATEGFAALHRATLQKRWLKDGENCADYLSFSQCVWKPHFIFTANPFGGFVSDNSDDADMMDQRQAEIVKPFIYLGKELHRQDLIERGVAAAQASCTLIIHERHIKNNIFAHPLFYPEGVAPENIDHEGLPECPMRTHPLWGEGSAVFTGLSEAYRSLGGLYIDPKNKIVVAVDGIKVDRSTLNENVADIRARGFLSPEFLLQPWDYVYSTDIRLENAKNFQIVVNGEKLNADNANQNSITIRQDGTVGLVFLNSNKQSK